MKFYSRFCTSEISPREKAHAQTDGRRIECVKLSGKYKFGIRQCLLRKRYHVVGERFVYSPTPDRPYLGEVADTESFGTHTKMIGSFTEETDGGGHFTQTATACDLTVNQYKHIAPMAECPPLGVIWVVDDLTIEVTFWENSYNLTEDVPLRVHFATFVLQWQNYSISNPRQGF